MHWFAVVKRTMHTDERRQGACTLGLVVALGAAIYSVSYTHLTLPTKVNV